MTLALAIIWSICLICDVIIANIPDNIRVEPTWWQVIIPTFLLVMNYWVEVFR